MRIYEMVGCPGCGKSTACDIVTKRLRDEGQKVGNLADFYFQHRKGRKKFGMIFRILFNFANYPLYIDAIRLKLKYGGKNGNWKYVGSLIFFMYEIVFVNKKESFDILVLDEGIIQYTSSLFFSEKLPKAFSADPVFAHLKKRGINPVVLLCDIGLEENIKRLKGRNVKTRFSQIPDDRLGEIMQTRKENLEIISGGFKHVHRVDMTATPEVISDNMMKLIKP